jgi:hypothetical protein
MQHEAAVVLHGAAEHDRLVDHVGAQGVGDLEVDAVEQHVHGHVGRLVDDDAEHAFVVVFADVHDRAAENRVTHRRHGDQEMICQVQFGLERAWLHQALGRLLGHPGHG